MGASSAVNFYFLMRRLQWQSFSNHWMREEGGGLSRLLHAVFVIPTI
jgi:hypothetical protein